MSRSNYWDGLEKTGYLFEMKVAEQLEQVHWNFNIDYAVSVLPDPSNLPVEETSIDFKAWRDNLFALIEARRASHKKWILFRKLSTRGFFVLTHHDDSKRRGDFQFHLQYNRATDRAWAHCQSLIRLQTDRGIYANAISVDSHELCKEGDEDKRSGDSEIRKGAKQASIATLGVINDDFSYMKRASSNIESPGRGRLYFPVITTAAKICVLDIPNSKISEEGVVPNVNDINLVEVPWAIYRFSLPRSLWLPVSLSENVINDHSILNKHRKLDICIVNILHLKEFLEEIGNVVE
ncbi:MAG: hypothetical protein ABSA11_08210 [Candidatus Bathyarchaeia archaeon]|jgi:hypothetical protein